MFLVRASAPGVGKSYLIDVIAVVATGEICPVITISKSDEETEKRLGAVLLEGLSIISLDNMTRDLEGELLCQLSERPVVRVRVLGRSEMPRCEVHTAIFSTGNNVAFAGDMTRRGFAIDLEMLDERPELREFQGDALKRAHENRAGYVAAALTIVRAYLAAGAPKMGGSFGSYAGWSTMVRSPLIWLGEPDPVASMEAAREEDPELSAIRTFFALWEVHLRMNDYDYLLAQIVDNACDKDMQGAWCAPVFREFLLSVAATRGREQEVSLIRLGKWLRRISGRIVNGHRLITGKHTTAKIATYRLAKV
jgi:hypothetical protein